MKLLAVKRISAQIPKGATFEADGMKARALLRMKLAVPADGERATAQVNAPPVKPTRTVSGPGPATTTEVTVTPEQMAADESAGNLSHTTSRDTRVGAQAFEPALVNTNASDVVVTTPRGSKSGRASRA